jgi:hypothetical protein
MSVITITLKNVSCSDEGVFRVAALLGDELASKTDIESLHDISTTKIENHVFFQLMHIILQLFEFEYY